MSVFFYLPHESALIVQLSTHNYLKNCLLLTPYSIFQRGVLDYNFFSINFNLFLALGNFHDTTFSKF